MSTDDLPPIESDGSDDDVVDPAIAGPLRVLLAAHVEDSIATDAAWGDIEREAAGRRAQRTRGRSILVAALAVAAVLAVVLVVRIESGREEPQELLLVTPRPEPDPTEGTDADSWVRLLGHVPDTEDATPLFVVDLQRAREQADVAPLPAGSSEAAWRAHSLATFENENILLSSVGRATPEELRAELGIGHEQFDQVVVRGVSGGGPRYTAVGRFDPTAIAAAVTADPLWGPDLDVRAYRGVTYYRWGQELKPTGKRSPVRDLGVGGRLVVGDGWVAWTSTDADAEATIDASLDPRTSLAADDPIRLAADSADDGALTSAIISVRGDDEPVSSTPPTPDPLPELPRIDRPASWSGGSGRPESVDIEQFRIGYDSEEQAAANLDAYTRNWERFAGDQDVAVVQEGSGLVATVRLPDGDGSGVVGVLSDGTTQRLNPGSFVLYLNIARP